ncbi:MAG: C4-dicarboxylate TRAP transporter substrate-binding protein [Pseudomonadota bacterium]|nr:C4-dicarboxylate TRAP transporter substrate-binding protein [Pseudomonadota bacterium]
MTRQFTTVSALALAAFTSMSGAAVAQETLRMTIAAGHPEVFAWVRLMEEVFMPAVNEELAKTGELQIEWTTAWGGTLVKLGAETQAMQDGIIDVAQASGIFDPANLGILNLSYAMPFGPTDPRLVAQAGDAALLAQEGFREQLAEETGAVLIGGGIALEGYNIATTMPLRTRADMAGVKIGGAGPNLAWLDTTGAVGVQGSYVSFYNDVKTGVVDGMISWSTGNAPAKIWEVAPYYNEVDFGAMYAGGLAVSKMRWDTFSEATKQAFITAADAYQDAYFDDLEASIEKAYAAMEAGGGEVVEFDEADRLAWINEMANPVVAWRQAALDRGEPVDEILTAYVAYLEDAGFTYPRDYLGELSE